MQPFIASSPLSIAPGRDRQFKYLRLRARKVFVNRDLHVNASHREYFFGKTRVVPLSICRPHFVEVPPAAARCLSNRHDRVADNAGVKMFMVRICLTISI